MNHRKPRTPTHRTTIRLSLLTTACLTTLATTTITPAHATTTTHNTARTGIALDEARSHANPRHPTDYDDEFTIHQLGTVLAAAVHNRATARSTGCTPDRPCRSIALSFQIITATGATHLNATNTSTALNNHCPNCQTLAGAYQFIISTPYQFTLNPTTRNQLNTYQQQLTALQNSQEPITTIKNHADTLATQIINLLHTALTTTPHRTTIDPLDLPPTITLHRHID